MKQFKNRINVIYFFFIVAFLATIVVLFFHQVVNGEGYRIASDDYYKRKFEDNNSNIRHSIFFVDKKEVLIPAAITVKAYRLVIDPSRINDKYELFGRLSQVINIKEEDFFNKTKNINSQYVVVKNNLNEEELNTVKDFRKDYHLPGLLIEDYNKRLYLNDNLASHILGYVGPNASDNINRGRYGIEKAYDNDLRPGPTQRDGNLVLTIDRWVQGVLESKLKTIQTREKSQKTGGVIIDPRNGDVIAMGAVPNFNPNRYFDIENINTFSNPIIEDVYELGSIFKPLTVAIALDSGAINTKYKYNDTGVVYIDKEDVNNYDKKARGPNTTLQDVLSQSLNVGIANIVPEIGTSRFKKYIEELGFRKRTNIDLPNEALNLSNNLDSPRLVEYVTVGYGHGLAVTPISMVKALSSLANEGKTVSPRIAKKVYRNGEYKTIKLENEHRVFEKSTVEDVTDMLVFAVDNALLNGALRKERYSVAAKTGTALLLDAENNTYYEERTLHSFFGYFPAHDPKYLILLYTVDSKESEFASESLARPLMDIVDSLISYYNISPDR